MRSNGNGFRDAVFRSHSSSGEHAVETPRDTRDAMQVAMCACRPRFWRFPLCDLPKVGYTPVLRTTQTRPRSLFLCLKRAGEDLYFSVQK